MNTPNPKKPHPFQRHFSRQQAVAHQKNVARNLGIRVFNSNEVDNNANKYKQPHLGQREKLKAQKRREKLLGNNPPDIQRSSGKQGSEDQSSEQAATRESEDQTGEVVHESQTNDEGNRSGG